MPLLKALAVAVVLFGRGCIDDVHRQAHAQRLKYYRLTDIVSELPLAGKFVNEAK